MALRILQAGMGGWGRDWAKEVVPTVEGIEPVGYVDTSPESLALTRKALGASEGSCFDSLEAGIEATEPDAVLVTASLVGHAPLTRAALEAGRHVLVEKPFAPSVAEARELVELADRSGLVLMVSQNYRFFPAPRAVRALIEGDTLGEPGLVNLQFRWNVRPGQGRRGRIFADPQPLLMDMSIHHFDLMRFVLGREAREIYCRTSHPDWSGFDGPPSAVATVRFDGDVLVSYQGSWVSAGPRTPWAGEWRMELERGEITWTSRGNPGERARSERASVHTLGGEEQPVELPTVRHVDRAGSLEEFARAIREGREPESSGRDNLLSLAITAAAIQSAASGRPVELPEG